MSWIKVRGSRVLNPVPDSFPAVEEKGWKSFWRLGQSSRDLIGDGFLECAPAYVKNE
jgi:hypothetical protein